MKPIYRRLAGLAFAAMALPAAVAQDAQGRAPAGAPAEPPTRSALDAPLFFQLLVGEMELRSGQPGNAYQVVLDAARRTKDEALFRRAVEIALQARAGDQALEATRSWRQALPQSVEALRYQVQLLAALNRGGDAAEPLRALLAAAPAPERPGIISALPRLFQRDRKQAAELLEQALQPYLQAPGTKSAAQVALGRAWLNAGDSARALALAERAQADEPAAPGAALLAIELIPSQSAAEKTVLAYLAQPKAEAMVRLAYVRGLMNSQRYGEAATQLQRVTTEQPDLAPPWLNLGALWLELRKPADAEQALQRYIALAQAAPAAGITVAEEDDEGPPSADRGIVQAKLMLAQAAEMRGDFPAAERWLAQVDQPQRALEVQTRRASLLARQDKITEARELIRRAPERTPDDARAKLVAEAQVLRDVKRWREANEVLGQANQRFPQDADLLYEQAMTAEKLNRLDDMEALLKRVLALKPDHHHAYNALGYSLADRGLRLPEARSLIQKALALVPGDPFVTDSLGWVEYRMGNRAEALRLLRQAYSARPDVEIAAHLAEVLWVDGQREEARVVLRDARGRDATNEVLRETVARLKVDL